MNPMIEILSPAGRVRAGDHPLAPRPASPAGRRIAFFHNTKPNADVLLGRLEELMAADAPAACVRWRKGDPTAPDDRIADLVPRVDLAVLAVGD